MTPFVLLRKRAIPAKIACDDHLAAGQQRRRVIRASDVEAAGLLETKRKRPCSFCSGDANLRSAIG